MVRNGPELRPPKLSTDALNDLVPETVEVQLPGLPALPAVRPKGGPDLPFEK